MGSDKSQGEGEQVHLKSLIYLVMQDLLAI